MARELVIYTDESDKSGAYFSNFYGGLAIESMHHDQIVQHLASVKAEIGVAAELKWQKVSSAYLDRYIGFADVLFSYIARGEIKVRVMFTQNRHVPVGLTHEQKAKQYHLLYYQFLKYAFGLQHATGQGEELMIRLHLDQMPENREQNAAFKGYILGLNRNPQFRNARIRFRADQIAEVRSCDHLPMQAIDIVLGAIQFRLNDKHKEKPEGQRFRGKRTVAKESLYSVISRHIREIYPNFNIGVSTGTANGVADRWLHAYRHWNFVPANHTVDESKRKQK